MSIIGRKSGKCQKAYEQILEHNRLKPTYMYKCMNYLWAPIKYASIIINNNRVGILDYNDQYSLIEHSIQSLNRSFKIVMDPSMVY